MALAEQVINAAVSRAESFSALAGEATADIANATRKVYISPDYLNLTLGQFDAAFVRPDEDTTPMPVYDAPAINFPAAPTLVALSDVSLPGLPDAPTINSEGLFDQTAPSSVMPDWDEANPDLHVDDIYNDLANTAAPILADVDLPTITPLTLPTAPGLQLPDYEAYATPEAIPAPRDYAGFMEAKYNSLLPEMQSFINDQAANWISTYAPEYEEQRSTLSTKILAGMNAQILPDEFESAMYTRAQGRTEAEYIEAEEAILANAEKRGFIIPSSAVTSAMNKVRLAGAASLSNQATDIYIERRKSEIQHLQFAMGIAAQQIQTVRNAILQVLQTGLSTIQHSYALADQITNKLVVMFEHERSRHEFSLAIMKALNEQYEVKLKAALSGLEGYKLELEALKLQKDVEFKVVEGAKLQLEAQQLLVARYSALIDAIAKRAVVDELKIKEYGIRADVFKTNVQARLAAFEAYKAAIDGDKAKLQGELAKLEIFNSQIKSADLQLELQSKRLGAEVQTNAAKMSQYTGQLDAYKIGAQVALQKFTAGAEIKKMGLDIYKTNLQANLAVYEGELKLDLAWVQTQIDQFKANTERWSNAMQLEQKYTDLEIQKAIAISSGYSNIASASAQSATGMATVAASE